MAGKVFWLAVFSFFQHFEYIIPLTPMDEGSHHRGEHTVEVCDVSQAGGVQAHTWRSEQELRFRPVMRQGWKPKAQRPLGGLDCQHGHPWLQVLLSAHAAVKAGNGGQAESVDVHRLAPCSWAATEAEVGHWEGSQAVCVVGRDQGETQATDDHGGESQWGANLSGEICRELKETVLGTGFFRGGSSGAPWSYGCSHCRTEPGIPPPSFSVPSHLHTSQLCSSLGKVKLNWVFPAVSQKAREASHPILPLLVRETSPSWCWAMPVWRTGWRRQNEALLSSYSQVFCSTLLRTFLKWAPMPSQGCFCSWRAV